jgi:hypothetical protein
MKKAILFTVTYLVIAMFNGYCGTTSFFHSVSTKSNENNKIDLSGNFPDTRTRSLSEPIILMQYSTYLEATFYNNLGIIVIEIRDKENNIIFQDSINTNTQKQYQILVSTYGEGNFYIKFRNSQAQYMQGEFILQE